MRYISDDGKVFNTEHECTEWENDLRKRKEEQARKEEERRIKEEKLKAEKMERFDLIKKHKKELYEEIDSFQRDYGYSFPVTAMDLLIDQLIR